MIIISYDISDDKMRTNFTKMLKSNDIPEITRQTISFFMPPHSTTASNFSMSLFISTPPSIYIPIQVCVYYTPMGMFCQEENKKNSQKFMTAFIFTLFHICKPFYSFRKAFYCFICIAMLNSITDTML